MTEAAQAYWRRFRKVLEYIDAHLDEELSVEQLSRIAAFSKYHFHRQFTLLFGTTVHKYVQLLRLRRASYQLALHRSPDILQVALASGYESHEAFSRAFKKLFGQSPSEFREQPVWDPWFSNHQQLTELRTRHMTDQDRKNDVKIVSTPDRHVLVYEHRGDPKRVMESVRRFIEFRKAHHLHPSTTTTFNILYEHPDEVPAEAFRIDLCVGTDRKITDDRYGIVTKSIPGGRCAVLRHVGTDDTLFEAVKYLYATWLPESGEELRDVPLHIQRVHFSPEVPEHQAVSDIFLPLR